MIYEVLEMLKDGQINSGKYDSCVIPVVPMHVVSHSAPRVEMMSADSQDRHAHLILPAYAPDGELLTEAADERGGVGSRFG